MALLQTFEGKLPKTVFQKYLFLLSQLQDIPSYNFIPYKYGCFSFQSYEDKTTMAKQGFLSDGELLCRKDNVDYLSMLRDNDRRALITLKKLVGNLNIDELIRYVYRTYPYYAINSEIKDKYLSEAELEKATLSKPISNVPTLFTIGYEGKSIDVYLNQLIENDIKILCDIRYNAVSRKYGFSKEQLNRCLSKLNYRYLHFPELGIEPTQRIVLNTQDDYDALFRIYEKTILPLHTESIDKIYRLVIDNKLVAITCFELNYFQCHRSVVAKVLSNRYGLEIRHI
ncbi:MAG: DUF488 domain-containing protein [Candidatus Magnetobacterium sp. LHC-1]|nr:DUF488 domain-containing protein [Nitrospirota bacterium]